MKYAHFDAVTGLVLQLLDTEAFSYASLPAADYLLPLTDEQFSSAAVGTWYVANGALAPTAPAPTAAQSLAQAQADQIAKISSACAAALTSGFSSSAIGSARAYPSQDTDQLNLQSAVSASMAAPAGWSTPVWCANAGVWSFALHTTAQVQQVNADWLVYRTAIQAKYAGLVAKIAAAVIPADAQAVVW